MRITTGMIYDQGVASIQKRANDLLKVNQQVSLSKRILTPSDDPVAAAQALVVSQSINVNEQFQSNQKSARDLLSLSESQLRSAGDVLMEVRQLTVQLGSPTYSASDRKSIAAQLREDFGLLMGVANAQDGIGNYLYSGFRGDTQPFTGSVEAGVAYNGDGGRREIPVTASYSLAISDSGESIFLRGADASVPFAAAADPLNKGIATIDTATVADANKWNTATNDKNYSIRFAVAGAVTTYDILDSEGNSVLTNAPATNTPPLPGIYRNGGAIELKSLVSGGRDLGASVTIHGSPSNGDTFSIRPSAPAGVFNTMANIIKAAEDSATTNAVMSAVVAAGLNNLDTAHDNILTTISSLGSRINQADALISAGDETKLNYQATLSRLEDLDVAAAMTSISKNTVNLQAAEQSFTRISQLSLFNYL